MSTIWKLGLVCLLTTTALVASASRAEACTCVPADLPFAYQNSSDVFVGQVLGRVESGDTRYFVFRIRATYKGCTESAQVVLLSSPVESATCGIDLRVRRSYLITADREVSSGVFSIGSCGFNRPVGELSRSDWQFLDTRYNCCGDECACVHDDPVLCFADPCSVDSCEEGECVANYCGGCWAEFYTEMGQPVCTPCAGSADCGWGQVCSQDGECRTECFGDADCEPAQYCGRDSACHDCLASGDSTSADVVSACVREAELETVRRR